MAAPLGRVVQEPVARIGAHRLRRDHDDERIFPQVLRVLSRGVLDGCGVQERQAGQLLLDISQILPNLGRDQIGRALELIPDALELHGAILLERLQAEPAQNRQ